MTEPLLTAGEVAEILRVSESTVRNLRRRGELRYARIGGKVLFRGVDVDAYVESKIEGGPSGEVQVGGEADARVVVLPAGFLGLGDLG